MQFQYIPTKDSIQNLAYFCRLVLLNTFCALVFFVPVLFFVPVALLERRVKPHFSITNIMTPEFQIHHAEQTKQKRAVYQKMVN